VALIEASRLLLAYGIDYAARVQNGYVSPGTAGTRVHPKELENGPVSSENVPASPRAWTRIPYLSFPRNEGVPGSSPSVGFSGFAGFSVMKCRAGLRARGSPEVYAVSGAPSYLVLPGSWGEVVARPACHLQSSGVTVSHFQSVLRWRPGLASGRPAPRALRHHMKCSSSVGVGGPSCTARGAGAGSGSPSPRPGDLAVASQPQSLLLSRTRPPHERRAVDRALGGRPHLVRGARLKRRSELARTGPEARVDDMSTLDLAGRMVRLDDCRK